MSLAQSRWIWTQALSSSSSSSQQALHLLLRVGQRGTSGGKADAGKNQTLAAGGLNDSAVAISRQCSVLAQMCLALTT